MSYKSFSLLVAVFSLLPLVGCDEIPKDGLTKAEISLEFTGCELAAKEGQNYYYDSKCLENYVDTHPIFTTEFQPWRDSIAKRVEDRVTPANEEIIQFLAVDNLVFGGKAKGVRAVTDPDVLQLAKTALISSHPDIKRYLQDHFYGFILIDGVSYTGFAPKIVPIEGDRLKLGGVIIINVGNLRLGQSDKFMNLNQWMSFREKTTLQEFHEDDDGHRHSLDLFYSELENSTTEDFFTMFMVHEMAHIIAAVETHLHPDFQYKSGPIPYAEFERVNPSNPLRAFPFLDFSYEKSVRVGEDGKKEVVLTPKVPREVAEILSEKPVRFYTAPIEKKYTIDEASLLYNELNTTCFTSLYATVDYTEDFAETLTHYFLNLSGFGTYKTSLVEKSSGEKIGDFSSPLLSSSRCREKLNFIQDIFR